MFKSVFKILCVACLVSIPCGVSLAQEATEPSTLAPVPAQKQVLIDELLTLTKQRQNSAQITEAMLVQTETILPQFIADTLAQTTDLKDKDAAAFKDKVTELSTRLAKRYRELLPQRVDVGEVSAQITSALYAKYYTEADLKGLITFYQTPLGQKTIEITPQLSAEALQQSNQILLPKIIEVVQEILREELGSPSGQ
ncbi:MAG: DUF2059 domain-containing protein [Thermosynechococcaceae cyanobacterium]